MARVLQNGNTGINLPPFSEITIYALVLFIILLIALLILVLVGVIPRVVQPRNVQLSEVHRGQAHVELDPKNVFAVDQSISVTAILTEADPGIVNNPTITLHNTVGDSELQLAKQEEESLWCATGTISYTKPGDHDITYDFGFVDTTEPIGEIESAMTYLHYRTSKYILIFSILSAIIASASLILTLRT